VSTYLENRFRIRPLGVVSKNDIGLRKMAYAILSCSFRDACDHSPQVSRRIAYLHAGKAALAQASHDPQDVQQTLVDCCQNPSCIY